MGRLTHRTAPGSTYFVTTKTWASRSVFQVPENAQILIWNLFHYREKRAYLMHEFVVMPSHLHLLMTPGPTTTLEKAVQLIKGGSSHQIHKERETRLVIWHAGFHDWTIRNEEDYRAKSQYIHNNPVKEGLVETPEAWQFGSASRKFLLDPMPERLQANFRG